MLDTQQGLLPNKHFYFLFTFLSKSNVQRPIFFLIGRSISVVILVTYSVRPGSRLGFVFCFWELICAKCTPLCKCLTVLLMCRFDSSTLPWPTQFYSACRFCFDYCLTSFGNLLGEEKCPFGVVDVSKKRRCCNPISMATAIATLRCGRSLYADFAQARFRCVIMFNPSDSLWVIVKPRRIIVVLQQNDFCCKAVSQASVYYNIELYSILSTPAEFSAFS